MKRLCLLRHAKSSWDEPALPDIKRILNKRGRKEAKLMARRFKEQGIHPQAFFSSPAVRALDTAEAVARKLEFPIKKIRVVKAMYRSSVYTLLRVIKKIDDSVDTVLFAGHNPEFTGLANYLTCRRIKNIPTCGLACIDFNLGSWKRVARRKGELALFDFPKKAASKTW